MKATSPISVIVNGAPKSGTLYMAEMLRHNLARPGCRIATRGFVESRLMPDQLSEFIRDGNTVAQQHMAPIDYNFRLLERFPPDVFLFLLRDPRDAVISWYHHITRDGIPEWEKSLYRAEDLVPADFWRCPPREALSGLTTTYFSRLCQWQEDWLRHIARTPQPGFYIVHFDAMRHGSPVFWSTIFHLVGLDDRPCEILPPAGSRHFRAGTSRQYLSRFSAEEIERMNAEMRRHAHLGKMFAGLQIEAADDAAAVLLGLGTTPRAAAAASH